MPNHSRIIDQLTRDFGERVSRSDSLLRQHGHDESYHPSHPPEAVVFPESTQEVAQIVRYCAEARCPIVPFGIGSSLEGHVAALEGGISLDMSRMDRILSVNEEDLDCRVEAGATRRQLNRRVGNDGLFFAVDPGADATIGGMAATRASGTNAVRYGTMRECVLGLTVVLPDGRVIPTGGRARKSSAGYDLTRLFVGSEGTLGVITEVQLKLHGIPEAVSAAVCSFESLEGASNTAITAVQLALPVARIELLDEVQMQAVNSYSQFEYPVLPTLFFEFHGSPAGVEECAREVAELAAEQGGGDFRWATRPEERERLWQARHDAYYAALSLRPGKKGWPTDVCVPISQMADCILKTKADIEEAGLVAPLLGHVGDGNFHILFVFDPDDHDEVARIEHVNDRMIARSLEVGGTCSGEHGIGYGKIPFLEAEHGAGVEAMRQIKRAFDPQNIMNPGKIFRL